MPAIYLAPLLILAIAFTLLFSLLLVLRMRAALIERKIEALKLLAAEETAPVRRRRPPLPAGVAG
jgi:hypothetical protein